MAKRTDFVEEVATTRELKQHIHTCMIPPLIIIVHSFKFIFRVLLILLWFIPLSLLACPTARPSMTLCVRVLGMWLDDRAVHELEHVDVFESGMYLHLFFKRLAEGVGRVMGERDDFAGSGGPSLEVDGTVDSAAGSDQKQRAESREARWTYTLKPPPPISLRSWKPWMIGNVSFAIVVAGVNRQRNDFVDRARAACIHGLSHHVMGLMHFELSRHTPFSPQSLEINGM